MTTPDESKVSESNTTDGSSASPNGTRSSDGRPGVSYRVVFRALLVSLVLATGVGTYIYLRYVRYERVAALHLPPGTQAALRFDLEQVVLYEPFRRHLLPLANEHDGLVASPPDGVPADRVKPRLERLESFTHLELAVDVRELAIGFGPGEQQWVVILGGMFPSEGVVEGLGRLLQEEGVTFREDRALCGGHGCIVLDSGQALGQAEDGALVVASSAEQLGRALVPSKVHEALGVPLEGPGSVGMMGEFARQQVPAPLRLLVPPLRALERLARVHGNIQLGTELRLVGEVEFSEGTGPEAAQRVGELTAALETAAALPLGRQLGLEPWRGFLDRIEVTPGGPQTANVSASWHRTEMEAPAAALARQLRQWFGWAGSPPSN